jgi:hypothetical protein
MKLNEIGNLDAATPPETMETLEVIDIIYLDFDGMYQIGVIIMNKQHVADICAFLS